LVEPSIRFAAGVACRSRSRRRGPSCHTGKIHAEWPGQHLGRQSAHRGLFPPRRRPDASRCNARPGLTATDDGEASAERGERFCRGQPNAIGGTRDQDLLVVHGRAIPAYGRTPDDLDGQGLSTAPRCADIDREQRLRTTLSAHPRWPTVERTLTEVVDAYGVNWLQNNSGHREGSVHGTISRAGEGIHRALEADMELVDLRMYS
jgi:hypothetical protein